MEEQDIDKAFGEIIKGLRGTMPDPSVAIDAAELAEVAAILSETSQMVSCFLSALLSVEEGETPPSFPDAGLSIMDAVVKSCEILSDLIHSAICDCDCEEDE